MEFDAIIIGAGQAGSPLASGLSKLSWKVALIEQSQLGSTCINTGCTPTKTLVHRAEVPHYARNASRWGVSTKDVSVDLPKIVAQKDALIQSRRDGCSESRGTFHSCG
ncbi:MAG TPA: FAD-dependent oxidoreductase [Candidatus Acidoferrum sp.]|nr:FAD-dependent oxidoreductase [Candidatus Acidoferrum sp.]